MCRRPTYLHTLICLTYLPNYLHPTLLDNDLLPYQLLLPPPDDYYYYYTTPPPPPAFLPTASHFPVPSSPSHPALSSPAELASRSSGSTRHPVAPCAQPLGEASLVRRRIIPLPSLPTPVAPVPSQTWLRGAVGRISLTIIFPPPTAYQLPGPDVLTSLPSSCSRLDPAKSHSHPTAPSRTCGTAPVLLTLL